MGVVKRIVCLANSRKQSGRCIAGKEPPGARPSAWIRPVSARATHEVSEYERQYPDGSDPRPLDIIEMPLLEACPDGYQQENWLLDPQHCWRRAGRASWVDLQRLVDPDEALWIDGHSTSGGCNDKIPLELTAGLQSSLRLIRVDALALHVFESGGSFGNPRRRVQARFRHHGTSYWLWVTDPVYEREALLRPDGSYPIGTSTLTVSLGEPFGGACYKLVAAIFERDRDAPS